MTVGGARQEDFFRREICLMDNLHNGFHHALDADAVHAAEINRTFAQKTR
jgi:hypothetical protein